jgi:CubicO group peptidase (beta-lactamase class C family)
MDSEIVICCQIGRPASIGPLTWGAPAGALFSTANDMGKLMSYIFSSAPSFDTSTLHESLSPLSGN